MTGLYTAQEALKAVPRHSAVPKISMIVVSPMSGAQTFDREKQKREELKELELVNRLEHLNGI